jgi:TPR repeat protein
MMKSLIILTAICLLSPSLLAQSFESGMYAYERRDYATALNAFNASANSGDPDAQFMLGRLYANGYGVLQDYIQAYKWYNLAASQGQRFALAARDAIAERMTAEQIAKSQDLAWEWRPDPATNPVSSTTFARDAASVPEQPADETTVARIQLQLKQLGYPMDAITGRVDQQTQAAIRGYQLDNQLFIDGIPSTELLDHILVTVGIEEPPIRRGNATPPPINLEELPTRRLY